MPESAATPASAPTEADFDLARTALHEITPPATIGDPAGSIDEGDGIVSVFFDATMPGYPGWRWTVSIAHVDGSEPSVLETELTPGDTALLSPAWVPWADRLADYKATQAELAAAGELVDDEDHDDHDDDDDDDDFDDDDDLSDDDALLHSGDLDGVDIDSLEDDDSENDDSDDDDSNDDDSDDDDDEESAPPVGVDESDEAEPEAGDASPEPPAVARRQQRRKKQQEDG